MVQFRYVQNPTRLQRFERQMRRMRLSRFMRGMPCSCIWAFKWFHRLLWWSSWTCRVERRLFNWRPLVCLSTKKVTLRSCGMDSKSLSETYLSNIQPLNKKLGVQVEVVLSSPQAHVILKKCLWMAENEQHLQGEQDESSPHFPLSIRCPSSASSIQYIKTLPRAN